jgi:ABC-type siderophore export system, fused ATPase and permease components
MLLENEKVIEKTDKKAQTIMRISSSFGDLLSFFVIGVTCFIFVNYYAVEVEHLVGVVMTLLYIAGPISIILSAIPELAVAGISYNKLNSIVGDLPDEGVSHHVSVVPEWKTIRLDKLCYQYSGHSGEPGFSIGPFDLNIQRGEITFIAGGNGSGKSTLSKLLTLHYRPSAGDIYFDSVKLSKDNIAEYRNIVSAIFTDFYLFRNLLMTIDKRVEGEVKYYLNRLKLNGKVKLDGDAFSTLALSDGQKKRLALLVAFIEDKQLYLFDEWAADQDPEFKGIFYNEILPALKKAGKAVVVITHDDRYFDLADKLVVMENGRIAKVVSQHKADVDSMEY